MKRFLWTINNIIGWKFYLYLTLVILVALMPALAALVAKAIVDNLVQLRGWLPISYLIGIEGLIIMGRVGLEQIISYMENYMRYVLVQGIQLRNVEQSSRLDISFFENPQQCDLLYRVRQESYHRPIQLFFSLSQILIGIVTSLSFFIILISWQPLIALLYLVGSIPLLRWGQNAAYSSWTSHDISTADGRRAAYFDELLTERHAAKEVRLHNLSPLLIPRLREHDTRHRKMQLKGVRGKTIGLIPGRILGVITQYAAIAWSAWQVAQGELSIGQFTLIVTALTVVRQVFQGIIGEYVEIQENLHFAKELHAFWDLGPTITSPLYPIKIEHLTQSLKLENVSFSYSEQGPPVLSNINLEIRPNESIGLVGVNGAGKSTLVKLICRLYDPTNGKISWDNIDIKQIDVDNYRRKLSVAFQDSVQYQIGFAENITISEEFELDKDRLETALLASGLSRMTLQLAEGLDTLLGRQFNVHGAELSGGQWQRIALARALYKKSEILILDEPTSAMDAEQEAKLFESIEKWKNGRALILVSHRLSSVRLCDRIIVLDSGKVVEEGSHAQLMSSCGIYANLFNIQAKGYSSSNEVLQD